MRATLKPGESVHINPARIPPGQVVRVTVTCVHVLSKAAETPVPVVSLLLELTGTGSPRPEKVGNEV